MLSATDQFTTRIYNIAVLPGDGIGPEVMEEAIKVLKTIERILTSGGMISTSNDTHSHSGSGNDSICGCPSSSPTQRLGVEVNTTGGRSTRMVRFNLMYGMIGGAAFDQYGCHLPDETLHLIEKSNAVLLGSVGGPVEANREPKWQDGKRVKRKPKKKHGKKNHNREKAVR